MLQQARVTGDDGHWLPQVMGDDRGPFFPQPLDLFEVGDVLRDDDHLRLDDDRHRVHQDRNRRSVRTPDDELDWALTLSTQRLTGWKVVEVEGSAVRIEHLVG